jgi:cell division protease FtsH
MITKYGMSENLGLVAYDSDSDEVFIGRDWGHTKSYSENVAAAIDEEVRQMIEKCHDQAKQIILEHSYVLHECAKQLMEKEKLSRAEFEAIFEQEAQMTGTAPEVSGEI